MLKLRVITALVLLPVVLGAMYFLERQAFAVVAAVFFLAGGWEWSGMMRAPGKAVRVIWVAGLAGLLLAASGAFDELAHAVQDLLAPVEAFRQRGLTGCIGLAEAERNHIALTGSGEEVVGDGARALVAVLGLLGE